MESLASAGVWLFAGLVVYTYVGYPVLVWARSRWRPAERLVGPSRNGRVTIVLAAHNEEAAVEKRLANIGELEWAPAGLDVVVASDGSTDRTDEIVSRWPDARVRLLRLSRGGRASAHNRALSEATGQFVVFTDAETSFRKDFLVHLLRPFGDAGVGCVVGRLAYLADPRSVAADTARYWEVETRIRTWESRTGWFAVGTGCAMAVRRELFRPLQPDEDADDAVPLDVLLQGYRVVFAPGAVAFDVPPGTAAGELAARARMTVLALTALLRRKTLLNPLRFPGLTLALLSHRLLRVLTPVFLGGLLVTSAVAVTRPVGLAALVGQLLVYVVGALAGWLGGRAPAVARMAWSFCVWNSGFALGLARFVAGRRLTQY